MSFLCIDTATLDRIASAVAFADGDRYTLKDLQNEPSCMSINSSDLLKNVCVDAVLAKQQDPSRKQLSFDQRHRVKIPIGYTATLTIEEQPAPLGWVRHLSIYVECEDLFPDPLSTQAIMIAFGFQRPLLECYFFLGGGAVNVIEILEIGPMPALG